MRFIQLLIDSDLIPRFMGLNDLMTEIKQDPTSFSGDESMENKVLKQVLALVEDKISEVKNQAVKWCVLSSTRHFLLDKRVRGQWMNANAVEPFRQSRAIDQDLATDSDGARRR